MLGRAVGADCRGPATNLSTGSDGYVVAQVDSTVTSEERFAAEQSPAM